MSRTLITLAGLAIGSLAAAQDTLRPVGFPLLVNDRWTNVIAMEASLDYNANSLRNELPIALWKGSYLDRDLRERSLGNMRERNSVGYAISARATWWGRTDERGWRTMASVAHHEQLGVRFTRDLFALTFFGNANYEERRADLGPSAATAIRYQTVGIGQHHVKSGSWWRWDIVVGQSLDAIDVRWASLYTGADGRVLRASVLSEHYRNDTTGSRFGSVNGMGTAVSGRWETQLGRGRPNVRFSLEARDLGLVNWFGQALLKDTIIEYTGIGVANLLELDNVIIGEEQLLDTFGLRYDNITFTRPLPFFIEARMRAPLGDGWTGSVALDQRYLPGYVPQLSFTGERRIMNNMLGSATLGFGGFGGLRLGANARYLITDRVLIELSSPHLPGFFSGAAHSAGVLFGASVGF
ncbi:MAG: hypothetical protein IPL52_01695 [Flavobacteriales bacterium]|nr:hypothetical protein [Flavobacteriales bacterium]